MMAEPEQMELSCQNLGRDYNIWSRKCNVFPTFDPVSPTARGSPLWVKDEFKSPRQAKLVKGSTNI